MLARLIERIRGLLGREGRSRASHVERGNAKGESWYERAYDDLSARLLSMTKTLDRRLALSALSLFAGLACAVRPRMVAGPCGEPRAASTTLDEAALPVHIGEIVGWVNSPWAAPRAIQLDGRTPVEVDRTGAFRFSGVAAGHHVLTTRAIGFAPQSDTVSLPENGGISIVIIPRARAVSPCVGKTGQ
jgi:hypothetical protein